MTDLPIKVSKTIPLNRYASSTFIQGMIDRMIVGQHNYHGVGQPSLEDRAKEGKALQMMYQRLDKYADDGNTEWLIDAANCLMIEFMFPRHYKAHFTPTTAAQSPGMPE